jgi:hypothetical protein
MRRTNEYTDNHSSGSSRLFSSAIHRRIAKKTYKESVVIEGELKTSPLQEDNMQKKVPTVNNLFKDERYSKKIYLSFSSSYAGDDYDGYEKNLTVSNLNPICIKGYVREINPEALVWKQYGLANIGAKEVLCEQKYDSYFRKCTKITIDGEKYQVFKEGVGNRAIIQKRPFQTMRVVLQRVD